MIESGHGGLSLEAEPSGDGTPGDRGGRSPRPSSRAVVALAVATAACAYALVVLGSTVRVTNSGMGCPSWPLCFGRIGPVDQYHALLEQSHRYLVALVTAGAFATAIAARRSRTRRIAFVPAAVGASLVVVQAGLGALTVFAKNAPWTVAVHLVVGLVFLASTVVTAVAAARATRGSWSPWAIGRWGWAAVVAALAVVVGGTLVVANGAGGACASWPLCPSRAPGSSAWQLLHRSLAGVAGISIAGFAWSRWRTTAGWRAWRAGALGSVGLYVAVAAFGAASALSRATASWQDAHLALAALLWGVVVAMVAVLATGGPPSERQPAD